jgi:hypothetical protein
MPSALLADAFAIAPGPRFARWMRAPLGIRLAQALYHGTDHRSRACTALMTLGIEPSGIEVWDFAARDGRMFTIESTGSAEPAS